MSEDNVIICRCEEITEKELKELIKEHQLQTAEQIKLFSHLGKGACQGKICYQLLAKFLAKEQKKDITEIELPTTAQPIRPLPLEALGNKV